MKRLTKYAVMVLAVAVMAALTSTAQAGVPLYTLTPLPGLRDSALGINDAGHVVGRDGSAASGYRAFLWDSVNGVQDLGSLGGGSSEAFAINNSGQVVGWARVGEESHAFLWDSVNGRRVLGTSTAGTIAVPAPSRNLPRWRANRVAARFCERARIA